MTFASARIDDIAARAYGNALLSRLPIVADRNHDLSFRRYEPRGCLEVTITSPLETSLQIYNVHLGTGFFERRYQAHRLFDVIEDNPAAAPRIVLGDFNEWTRGRTTHLLSNHLNSAEPERLAGRARSYPGVFPLLHLDHIYYDSQLKLKRISVHRSRLALARFRSPADRRRV